MGRLRFKSALKWCCVLLALSALAALGVRLRSFGYLNTKMKRQDSIMTILSDAGYLGSSENSPAAVANGEARRVLSATRDSRFHPDEMQSSRSPKDSVMDTNRLNADQNHEPAKFIMRGRKFKLKKASRQFIRRFPRIMIVGFGKAGTRALFDVLKMRPDTCGPVTERRFFSDHYDRGLKYYLGSLPEPTSGGLVVEKSPDYITDERVPGRIIASLKKLGISIKELKFVIVLRDPIDRAMSEYLEWQISRQQSGNMKLPPFPVMVMNRNATINSEQPFLRASNYARYIKHWFQYFNRTQTCFVDGDKFVKDPFSEILLLETCLHLQPYFTPGHFVYESKRGFYCFKASLNQTEPYCMGSTKGRKHPPIPNPVLSALRKHYQPPDSQLLALTGRTMQWLQQSE